MLETRFPAASPSPEFCPAYSCCHWKKESGSSHTAARPCYAMLCYAVSLLPCLPGEWPRDTPACVPEGSGHPSLHPRQPVEKDTSPPHKLKSKAGVVLFLPFRRRRRLPTKGGRSVPEKALCEGARRSRGGTRGPSRGWAEALLGRDASRGESRTGGYFATAGGPRR